MLAAKLGAEANATKKTHTLEETTMHLLSHCAVYCVCVSTWPKNRNKAPIKADHARLCKTSTMFSSSEARFAIALQNCISV